MSKRKKVFDFLSSQKADKDGWIRMTNRMLAEKLGMPIQEIQQIVGSLKNTKNIDTLIGDDGKVAAYKIVQEPSMWRRVTGRRRSRKGKDQQSQSAVAAPKRSNVIHLTRTPNIDRYAQAKEVFEKMISTEDVKEYISAEWRADPTAEEGLNLKNQLLAARQRLAELQETYTQEHRELEYLRRARDEKFREALTTAGVVHAGQKPAAQRAAG